MSVEAGRYLTASTPIPLLEDDIRVGVKQAVPIEAFEDATFLVQLVADLVNRLTEHHDLEPRSVRAAVEPIPIGQQQWRAVSVTALRKRP